MSPPPLGSGPTSLLVDTVRLLSETLAAHDSATDVLERWGRERGQFAGPITARVERNEQPQTPAECLAALGADPSEIRHRHVWLYGGTRLLSVADNWFAPSRLTGAMADRLQHTNAPFGVVVKPLNCTRRTLRADILVGSPGAAPDDACILRHRAILARADGTPVSLVDERYTAGILPDDVYERFFGGVPAGPEPAQTGAA